MPAPRALGADPEVDGDSGLLDGGGPLAILERIVDLIADTFEWLWGLFA
nr:hypothetical protein [Natrinema saccharevitans]